ncbi:MAG: helix-turn-helix domain-containing protein, partial [Gammaproteobacteria bacterium]
VWVQMVYTMLAATLLIGKWVREPASRECREHLWLFMAVFGFLHAGQIIRILRPDDPRFLDIVPIALTLSLFTILAYAVVRSRALMVLTREPTGEPPGRIEEDLARSIERAMRNKKLFTDPGLGVQELAAQIGVPPKSISRAVNRSLGMSLPNYLTQCRLREAERLLTDPKEHRFTVEGIGRQAGFGSRSAFYRAFQEKYGESPAGFRKRLLTQNPSV